MLTFAKIKTMADCEFDRLFTRGVPHILEKIFFSFDYNSFVACREVSNAWNELHSSEPYQQMANELLVEKRMNEEKLIRSSLEGNAGEVRKVLASGVNINCKAENCLNYGAENCLIYGVTPLYGAAKKGHINVVKLLLDAGADPNAEDVFGDNALYCPVRDGNTDVVKLLLEAGADPNIWNTWNIWNIWTLIYGIYGP